jgi:hypothetical protein
MSGLRRRRRLGCPGFASIRRPGAYTGAAEPRLESPPDRPRWPGGDGPGYRGGLPWPPPCPPPTAGSGAEFEAFYDATIGHARALARRILQGADLEDALADACPDAWRMAGRYDPDRGSPVTWLPGIVHGRALDRWRRHGAATVAEQESESPGADPGERPWPLESGRRLAQALATLSAHERRLPASA